MEKTLTGLLIEYYNQRGLNKDIFFTKENDLYTSLTSGQLFRKIYSLIKYLEKNNFKENDKVAIISDNCIEWVITDFACMFLKLISIPIYTSLSSSQVEYILENSGSGICFVSNSFQLDKVNSIRKNLPELKKVIPYKDLSKIPHSEYDNLFSELITEDPTVSDKGIFDYLKDLSAKVKEQDILTIIYTSGTTGIPKGVMLAHENFYSNVEACQKVLTINDNDTFLSYLPYSHAYERTAGYYLALFSGAKIYYAQNIETIAAQLPEAKPTIVITVPRLLDKIYYKLQNSGEDMEPGLKKKLFLWAVGMANGKNISKSSLSYKIADLLVYKKIRMKTGGRVRHFISGGGALNSTVGNFFDNIGIQVLEGYGLTETSPVISVNPPLKNKYGTVGPPLEGVTVKIADDNEILIKGDLVMKGYYKDEVNTSDMIKDGWLHTGDIGELDSDGYLKITDRKKAMMKTSGGKYVSPAQIEESVAGLKYIENIMIIGNERMFITALIVPVVAELEKFAKVNNIQYNSLNELISDSKLIRLIQKDIDELQKDLAHHERIRKLTLIDKPFTIEGGELTPTMKIKRKYVAEMYKNEIESMYPRM